MNPFVVCSALTTRHGVERLRGEKYEQVLAGLPHITRIDGRARFTAAGELEVNGRRQAIIARRTEGLIKMAIHAETRQVTAVHMLAPQAG